jgi:hypothetical protein
MNVTQYYRSLTVEMDSLKHRVRNFIHDKHWLTDGEWKESVLRLMIGRNLPDTVRIGRGFVLTAAGPTTQCDVLLYRAECPVLFRDGDLAFVTPDAVLGIIEVKARVDRRTLRASLEKFKKIGIKLGTYRKDCFFGLFAYDNAIHDQLTLAELREHCRELSHVVDLLNLGDSTFVKWWNVGPNGETDYMHWHSYRLAAMSAGYFISNVIAAVSPESVDRNGTFWFPGDPKEARLIARTPFAGRRTRPRKGSGPRRAIG